MRIGVLFLTLAVAASVNPAHAEGTPEAERKAKAHFAQATAFQEKGMYDHAVAEYQAAYALLPMPDFLFNIAQCYRQKGDPGSALRYYKLYLEADPDGRGRAEARAYIVELTSVVSEPSSAPAETQPARPPATQPDSAPASAPATAPATARVTSSPSPARMSRARRLAVIGSAGLGAVALGLGVYFGVDAASTWSDADARCDDDWVCDHQGHQLAVDAKSDAVLATVFLGGGLAALAVSGVLYLTARPEARQVTVAPASGGGLTLSWTGSF
jgi:tetratricopeptide (TPR) repeat protein